MEGRTLVKAKNAAIGLLARREHSEKELTLKLSKKFECEIVRETISVLRERGDLCDRRFAEMLVRSRFNRGFGPSYISKELRFKGVNPDLGKECLDIFDGQWHQKAEELLQKKRSQKVQLRDSEEEDGEFLIVSKTADDKLKRFLFGRGFPSEIVYKLFQ